MDSAESWSVRAARARLGPAGQLDRAGLLVAVIGPGLLAHTISP